MATNDSGETFDEQDLRSLGEKLASLDLTNGEQAALAAVFEGDGEVMGFGRFDILPTIKLGYRGIRKATGDPGAAGLRSDTAGWRAPANNLSDSDKRAPGRF